MSRVSALHETGRFVAGAALVLAVGILCWLPATAQTSRSIMNLQGRLTDKNGTPLVGEHSFKISIFNHPTAGVLKFTETQTVELTQGIYNIFVGSETAGGIPTSTFAGDTLYLEIQADADQPFSPRTQIVSTAYVMNADQLAGVEGTSLIPISSDITVANLDDLLDGGETTGHKHGASGGRNYDYSMGTSTSGWSNANAALWSGRYKALKLTMRGKNDVFYHHQSPAHLGGQGHYYLDVMIDGSRKGVCAHWHTHDGRWHHFPMFCTTVIEASHFNAGQTYTFDMHTQHGGAGAHLYVNYNGYSSSVFVEELIR